jgi:hypothetical protein
MRRFIRVGTLKRSPRDQLLNTAGLAGTTLRCEMGLLFLLEVEGGVLHAVVIHVAATLAELLVARGELFVLGPEGFEVKLGAINLAGRGMSEGVPETAGSAVLLALSLELGPPSLTFVVQTGFPAVPIAGQGNGEVTIMSVGRSSRQKASIACLLHPELAAKLAISDLPGGSLLGALLDAALSALASIVAINSENAQGRHKERASSVVNLRDTHRGHEAALGVKRGQSKCQNSKDSNETEHGAMGEEREQG